MLKKRLICILLLLILLTSFVGIFAGCGNKENIKVPSVQQDVYVYDQDNCIDDEVEVEINSIIKELNKKTKAEIAVVSITSLNGYSIEEYANELFNKLGIGKKDEDNGVLLLFSKTDKRVRLEIGRGLEGCLNDAKCGRILDDYFVPYREEGKYTQATRSTVIAVVNVIAKEYQVELENIEKIELDDEEETQEESIWLWVILIILIILVSFLKAADGGLYSGGSFGGFSGGGSSGGFGGGRSGGGGASR